MTGVTWYEAMAYSAWLGGGLPTEAQWELAARGPGGRLFPWGDQPPTRTRAAYDTTDLAPVGRHPGGATPEGIQDLAGSAREWCLDRYGQYPLAEGLDPVGPEHGTFRVVRGGSFSYDAQGLRAAYRYVSLPESGYYSIGFRVVWSLAGGQL